MNPQRQSLAHAALLRQPPLPQAGSVPQKSTLATLSTTHNLWDNPGCLSPQTPSEVSGFRLVDKLDKDS